MLRPSLLKSFNDNIISPGGMDIVINKIKGTIYTNCYTPAPDTPRGLAALYTGMYPKNNGCTSRIKWPKYYQNKDVKTIFDILFDSGYSTHINISKLEEQTGFLPERLPKDVNVYYSTNDIGKAFKQSVISENNQAYFITLNDYHWSLDELGHNSLGDHHGQRRLKQYLDNLFPSNNYDVVDHLFLYSDHGFMLDSERHKSPLFIADDSRSKIVMMTRNRGDTSLMVNRKLTSIIDIYPTIHEILNIKGSPECDGLSLFSDEEHKSIVIEDHKNFSVSLEQLIESWAVRTKDYFYFKNLESDKLFEVRSDNEYALVEGDISQIKQHLEQEIINNSSSYTETSKQYNILKYYENMQRTISDYSTGERRINRKNRFVQMVKIKLFRNKYLRW